jgi:hypothetical protein
LKSNSYTFTAQSGTTNTRFSLKYQKTLGITTTTFNENSIVLFKKDEKIFIKSDGLTIDNVQLFDMGGRLLLEKTKVNSNETSIESSKYVGQVLIVKIASGDKAVVSKKIVI